VTVFVLGGGVPAWERALYQFIGQYRTSTAIALFRWITTLGDESVLLPASMLWIFALPDRLLRRWWLWVAVVLLSSLLETYGKTVVARPRPTALSPGFPSAHTTAAAAFYVMAAYLAGQVVGSVRARVAS
jgi:membrane-associated phospholipid phosphatase